MLRKFSPEFRQFEFRGINAFREMNDIRLLQHAALFTMLTLLQNRVE